MKRKLTLLLACLMALTMALTGAAESLSPVGSWTLTGVEANGMTLDPAMLGMEITMTLNEDGTAEMGMSGLVEEGGTWSVEGDVVTVIDPDGEEMPMTLTEDGSLRAEQDGMAMIFTPATGDEGQSLMGAATEVAVLEDVAMEDFNGEWTAAYAVAQGIEVPLDTFGLAMDASIDNGNVTLTAYGSSDTMQAELAENALVAEQSGVQMPFYLREDGTLSLAMEQSGMTIEIIFERAA